MGCFGEAQSQIPQMDPTGSHPEKIRPRLLKAVLLFPAAAWQTAVVSFLS